MRFCVKIKIWEEKSVALFYEPKYFKLTTIQVKKYITANNRGLDIREATSEESGWLNHVI